MDLILIFLIKLFIEGIHLDTLISIQTWSLISKLLLNKNQIKNSTIYLKLFIRNFENVPYWMYTAWSVILYSVHLIWCIALWYNWTKPPLPVSKARLAWSAGLGCSLFFHFLYLSVCVLFKKENFESFWTIYKRIYLENSSIMFSRRLLKRLTRSK